MCKELRDFTTNALKAQENYMKNFLDKENTNVQIVHVTMAEKERKSPWKT